IAIHGVTKAFADIVALDGIDLDVARGELVCLLGPSGCGKSTLLSAVAGFVAPTSGEILADGKRVSEPGPDRGMVFQEYALFPWMTVRANIAFGLEMRGEADIRGTVDSLLAKLRLTEFANRFPKDLSGGMRQRVAIARILALDSPMLLIDESIYLADRIVVMTYRPGRVKAIVPVALPRPRDVSSLPFNELKRALSAMVMEEQRRSEEDALMAG